MEKIDMHSRNEYLKVIRESYCKARTRKEERIGGRVKRRYDVARTPYQRLMESGQLPEEAKEELQGIYCSLNPAELKRKTQHADPYKKLVPRIVRNYMIQQSPVGLDS